MENGTFWELIILPWALRILIAAAIAVAGFYLVRIATRLLDRILGRMNLDAMLRKFAISISKALLLLLLAIAVLSQLGIDTTSLVALIGAAGIAIGLALKESLGNFASGVMILVFRPFSVGHFIEGGGAMGTVDEIGIFHSRLISPDGREIILPNGMLYNGTITNFSTQPTRRVEVTVGIDYTDNIGEAKRVIEQVIGDDARVLADPAPVVIVGSLADSSINLIARVWVDRDDVMSMQSDLQERIKNAFDESGITIPFPQMVMHQTPAEAGERPAA